MVTAYQEQADTVISPSREKLLQGQMKSSLDSKKSQIPENSVTHLRQQTEVGEKLTGNCKGSVIMSDDAGKIWFL